MAPGCPSSDNFRALRKGSGVQELQIWALSLKGALNLFYIFIFQLPFELLNASCKAPAPLAGGAASP